MPTFQLLDVRVSNTLEVLLYGVDREGNSVTVRYEGFKPSFYVLESDHEYLKYETSITTSRHIFSKFNNYEPYSVKKLSFSNQRDYYNAKRFYTDNGKSTFFANLDFVLQFLHERNINPGGWVHWDGNEVSGIDSEDYAPFRITSIDIECISDTMGFPDPCKPKDYITQIGMTTNRLGSTEIDKVLLVIGKVEGVEDAHVIECVDEKDLIAKFALMIHEIDSDIVTGYNIFGFDYNYIWQRSTLYYTQRNNPLSKLGKGHSDSLLKNKSLETSAYGQNDYAYIDMPGRVSIDMYKYIHREYKLESLKLDFVAQTFFNGKILSIKGNAFTVSDDNLDLLRPGMYVSISEDIINIVEKTRIESIDGNVLTLVLNSDDLPRYFEGKYTWGLSKNDVEYSAMKGIHYGQDAKERGVIGSYCIQDNVICNMLAARLNSVYNYIAMANTCKVPFSYLVFRGQSIKTYSLIALECKKYDYIMEDRRFTESEKYQGAFVLDPEPGGYFNPVVCNDFAALYPSCIISENLSPDTFVDIEVEKRIRGRDYLLNHVQIKEDVRRTFLKVNDPKIDGYDPSKPIVRRGIFPTVLLQLLQKRKDVRKKMKGIDDPVALAVLDAQQLAYKVTCNSLYGQLGAAMSQVYCMAAAESTTATGRHFLCMARDAVLEHFPNARIVYGDTDSLMVDYVNNEEMTEQEKLQYSIDCGKRIEKVMDEKLPFPHKFEYEKTFYPYIIFGKKYYLGMKYETANDSGKIMSRGIVLNRRDNAKIVKYVYKTILMRLMEDKDVQGALEFLDDILKRLTGGNISMSLLKIVKPYNESATVQANNAIVEFWDEFKDFIEGRGMEGANPVDIKAVAAMEGRTDIVEYECKDKWATENAASALARKKRMRGETVERNQQLEYVFVINKRAKTQGDRVEDVDAVSRLKIPIDYGHYITNQIMKPVHELFKVFGYGTQCMEIFTDINKEFEARSDGLLPICFY